MAQGQAYALMGQTMKAAENFEIITFTGADAEAYLNASRDAGWAGVAGTDAALAEKLRPLFSN